MSNLNAVPTAAEKEAAEIASHKEYLGAVVQLMLGGMGSHLANTNAKADQMKDVLKVIEQPILERAEPIALQLQKRLPTLIDNAHHIEHASIADAEAKAGKNATLEDTFAIQEKLGYGMSEYLDSEATQINVTLVNSTAPDMARILKEYPGIESFCIYSALWDGLINLDGCPTKKRVHEAYDIAVGS